MTLNANKLLAAQSNKKPVDPLEPGSYPGRLVQAIILGIQTQRPYKGDTKPPCLMMRTTYEFLDEFLKDDNGEDRLDKPRWLSEEFPFYSLKADLAKSTKRYYALDPDSKAEGDWSKIMGNPCMITVVVDEYKDKAGVTKIKEKISGVSAMRPKEAAKAPTLVNPPLVWDFYNPDVEIFKSFPDWIQERIKSAVDYPGSVLANALGDRNIKSAERALEKVQLDVDDDHEMPVNNTEKEESW